MRLRKLEIKDAPYMLEWMHDSDVIRYMKKDFSAMTIEDCASFIKSCGDEHENIHRAIVNDNDEYLGTVSLKNINNTRKDAEFAITIRKCAMGTGVSSYGIKNIIKYGFENIGLESIYWYVSKENIRAIKFYDKNGYKRATLDKLFKTFEYTDKLIKSYLWYQVLK